MPSPVDRPSAPESGSAPPVRLEEPRRPLIAERHQLALHTTWRGTYHCAQGITGLALTVDVHPESVTAVFSFEAVDATPNVPTGGYRMTGTITPAPDGGFTIVLDPDAWILQPPNYSMVGIAASIDAEHRALRGRITHPSCTFLELTRVD